MELRKYKITTVDYETYEFWSEGSKGRIRKIIRFQRLEIELYNLGFGDWNEKVQGVDDRVRSNNNDKDRVLATVAAAVIEFMKYHPEAVIYAKGTTPARTRLYQIGLHRHWREISLLYSVKGIIQGVLTPFESGRNYDAFVLTAKEKK